MAINPYINLKNYTPEQNLVEDITIEIIQGMGQDCYYVPRKYFNPDRIFGENPASSFEKAYVLEMYIQSYKGFDGTDIVTQFGIEIKDKINLVFARKRFKQQVTDVDPNIIRPREGDLIYFPLSKSLFEINFVEHENPLYPLGRLYSYFITAELFTYSYEKITTENPDINKPYTTTDAIKGGTFVPKNIIIGTTVGLNYEFEDQAENFGFDGNSPGSANCGNCGPFNPGA